MTQRESFSKAFRAWARNYRRNPKKFNTAITTKKSYGDGCADYFIKLLLNQRGGR